jgi:Fe-S-cluster containining protein
MELEDRLAALGSIYNIYNEFAAAFDLACQKTCAHCCTTHVTLTTLEGYKLLGNLPLASKADLLNAIQTKQDANRFRPNITTNQLADFCAMGIDPPDETDAAAGTVCPLLADNLCSIYELRPFGCRCLVSRHDCGEKGHAEIDDFVLSMNTVFLQTIEHADVSGCTGNLTDVLEMLSAGDNWAAYENSTLSCKNTGLISNHPLKVLMIPPEHRTQMEPILNSLRKIRF